MTGFTALVASLLFGDAFETSRPEWITSDPSFVFLVESGDVEHGRVLQLTPAAGLPLAVLRRLFSRPPGEPVFALIAGSEAWGPVRIEGQVYFPEDGDSYLGFIYGYDDSGGRADFGSVYVIDKADERYVRVNPHYDWNPARALYEELRVGLAKPAERGWLEFAAEVVGSSCHFYVGDLATPVVTFEGYRGNGGRIGFNPRVVGAPVWLDNVRVRSIDRHTYTGPPRPQRPSLHPDGFLMDWEASGPFAEPQTEASGWRPFSADGRGAVVSAKLAEFFGERRIVYFRIHVALDTPQRLEFASAVRLVVRVNGTKVQLEGPNVGPLDFRRVAWFDFREGPQAWIELPPGDHEVTVEIKSDYSGVGFFARLR